MPRFLATLLGLVIGASIVAGIASAVAAVKLKKSAPPAAGRGRRRDRPRGRHGRGTARQQRHLLPGWAGSLLVRRRRPRPSRGAARPGGAHLEIRTVFGGTRVVVAPGIPVRTSGPAIFGGVMKADRRAVEATSDAAALGDRRLHALRRPAGIAWRSRARRSRPGRRGPERSAEPSAGRSHREVARPERATSASCAPGATSGHRPSDRSAP